MKYLNVLILICSILFALPSLARTQAAPPHLVPAEIESRRAETEIFGEPYPGLILTLKEAAADMDGKYNQPYHAVCAVYAAEQNGGKTTGYARRFLVHAPDAASLPLARRTAKLLLLLYGANHERLHFDHARTAPTLDVWLSRQEGAGLGDDIGGEQFGNQIYIYRIFTERAPAEWAREIAHEYGHYAVPGVSGFTAPEAWGNGVLGEKLFLRWLYEDLLAGRLKAAEMPFVTLEQHREWLDKQVFPLTWRIAKEGPDTHTLAKHDAAGMDAFCGLALAIEAIYGSRGLLDAFAYTEASGSGVFIKTEDFVRGIQKSLQSTLEFDIMPPLPDAKAERETFYVYLPRGDWQVTKEGPVRSWSLPAEAKGILSRSQTAVVLSRAEWRKITLVRTQPGTALVRLRFHRNGSDVN